MTIYLGTVMSSDKLSARRKAIVVACLLGSFEVNDRIASNGELEYSMAFNMAALEYCCPVDNLQGR